MLFVLLVVVMVLLAGAVLLRGGGRGGEHGRASKGRQSQDKDQFFHGFDM